MHRSDILYRIPSLSTEGLLRQEPLYYLAAEREAENEKIRHRYCFKVWFAIHQELEKRLKESNAKRLP